MIISDQFYKLLVNQQQQTNKSDKLSKQTLPLLNSGSKVIDDQFVQSSVFKNVSDVMGLNTLSTQLSSVDLEEYFSKSIKDPLISFILENTDLTGKNAFDEFDKNQEKLIKTLLTKISENVNSDTSSQLVKNTPVSKNDLIIKENLNKIIGDALKSAISIIDQDLSIKLNTNIGDILLNKEDNSLQLITKPIIEVVNNFIGEDLTSKNSLSTATNILKVISFLSQNIDSIISNQKLANSEISAGNDSQKNLIKASISTSQATDSTSGLKDILLNNKEYVIQSLSTNSQSIIDTRDIMTNMGLFSTETTDASSIFNPNSGLSFLSNSTSIANSSDLFSLLGNLISKQSGEDELVKEFASKQKSALKEILSNSETKPNTSQKGELSSNTISYTKKILDNINPNRDLKKLVDVLVENTKLSKSIKDKDESVSLKQLSDVSKEVTIVNSIENRELVLPFTFGDITGFFKEKEGRNDGGNSEDKGGFSLQLETSNLGKLNVIFDLENGIGIDFVSKNEQTRTLIRKDKKLLFDKLKEIIDTPISIGVH